MKHITLTIFLLLVLALRGTSQVAEKAEEISPLMISEKVPAEYLTSYTGTSESLLDIVKKKRTILLFYRGGWCPYCNAHLSDVGLIEDEIEALGYQMIGISPDAPDHLKKSMEQEQFRSVLYSDSDGSVMKAMGIAFSAPERYIDMLGTVSDNKNTGILPVPSLFIVDTDGTILFEYVSPNFKQRISADMLLDILKRLNIESQ